MGASAARCAVPSLGCGAVMDCTGGGECALFATSQQERGRLLRPQLCRTRGRSLQRACV